MNATLKKILAGVAVAAVVVIVALAALVAVFWDDAKVRGQNLVAIFTEEPEYAGGFEDRGQVLEYLASHPDDFSLVVRGDSGVEFEHEPDAPNPLASTKKIVVLAAYAKEVSEGNLDPKEEIAVSEWEKYYIPNTDGGAHPTAMERLGVPTDENGAATDPDATATLDETVSAMISNSDNAATDYLIERLGQRKINAVIEAENLDGQSRILPLSGSMLVWNTEEESSLESMSDAEYGSAVERATEEYASGGYPDEWREGRARLGSLVEQREAAMEHETTGTAEDYARVMAGVAAGEFISPEASTVMRRHLEWPMKDPANKEDFETLGAKGGSLAGVLNQAMYAVPKSGGFSGERRVVVLFTRDMSASAWLGATQSDGYSDFANSMLDDRKFAERVESELPTRRAVEKSENPVKETPDGN